MWQQSWQTWKVQVSYNKGGEWDWCPSPQFHGLYSEFLDGSGLWVSSCQLKVSSCQPRVSLERTPWIPWLHCPAGALLVTCLELPDSWKCHLSSLAICQSYPGWTLEFPGTVPGCDTIQTRTLDASRLLVPGCLELHSVWGPSSIVLTCIIFSANFFGLAYILHYLWKRILLDFYWNYFLYPRLRLMPKLVVCNQVDLLRTCSCSTVILTPVHHLFLSASLKTLFFLWVAFRA